MANFSANVRLTEPMPRDNLSRETTVAIPVPAKFENFLRRVLGLTKGRHILTVTVTDGEVFFTCQELAKFEK